MKIPLADQIKCVERELTLRKNTYPRWVAQGKPGWTKERADHQIAAMEAVLATLQNVFSGGSQGELFKSHNPPR